MASPHDIDALGSLSTEDLHFDIQVQTTILLSLEDAAPTDNTATEVQQAKQRIKSLRRILKTREAQEKGTTNYTLSSPCCSMNVLTIS